MTLETIIEDFNQILIDEFEIEPSLLHPKAQLREDLELDSLDGIDLVVAIEKHFKVRIPESDAREMQTLQDIYNHIEVLLKAGSDE